MKATPDDFLHALEHERQHLERARQGRLGMIERLTYILSHNSAADDITGEYVEVVARRGLLDLADASVAEFFGRIDYESYGINEHFHIGRRHIESAERDPIIVDWRANIAAPFYRATVRDPMDLVLRRRYSIVRGELVSFNDEHLDDPDAAEVAGGIPDPVLAEIGSARTGAMRDIIATIQGEQDYIIRAPMNRCLVVQGGPGTGKTAVGLHRAAFLLFEHRIKLEHEGVLVVGPNPIFLDYIAKVLPSLGERSVTMVTLPEMLMPKVPHTALDSDEVARIKGSARMAEVIEHAARASVKVPKEAVRSPIGLRTIVVEPDEIASWTNDSLANGLPFNQRRGVLKNIAKRELFRRTDKDDTFAKAEPLRKALDKAWPLVKPKELVEKLLRNEALLAEAAHGILTGDEQRLLLESSKATGKKHQWSAADGVLIDEAHNFLDGPLRTYGHIVIDEAQDLSEMAFRVIARRGPSRSMTILGDLAQSTSAAGQSNWQAVFDAINPAATTENDLAHLTIGYRVPGPILERANRLLADADVNVPMSRAARQDGDPPRDVTTTNALLAQTIASEWRRMATEHPLTGVLVPADRLVSIRMALADYGLTACQRLEQLAPGVDVPLFAAEASKGLEFDGVIVVGPDEIADGTPRGARLAYIALTRAVQQLVCISASGD